MAGSERRKKILHIVEDLKMGGIERVIQALALGLDPAKYDVHVWCLARGGTIADQMILQGATVKILGLTSYYNPARVRDLARMLDHEGFDIVHTHGYFASTFARLAALLIKRTRVVRHIHTTDIAFKPRNRKIERLLSLMSDRVICVSRAVGEFAAETLSVPPRKIRIVYNAAYADPAGCAAEDVEAWRVKLGLNGKHFVVASIASLTANKGHEVLVRAMRQVVENHENARCLIIGEGRERDHLESLIDSLDLRDRIFIVGMQGDVAPLLRVAHALALCSVYREGLSVALLEGAATGIPLIGSDLGGIPEVIEHGVNGFLFPPGNFSALARAVERLIEEPALWERMCRQSRDFGEMQFSKRRFIAAIDGIYKELTGAGA
jgi:glycosyltransferase involved in cell wall biosynthesis